MLEVSKSHLMSHTPGTFRMSGYLQELMCHFGQQEVYEQASESLAITRGLEISGKQIEHVCHYYGGIVGENLEEEIREGHAPYKEEELSGGHYVMVDGSMYLTREEGWKEVKLARIFSCQDHVGQVSKNRGLICQSDYLAHLGSHKEFLIKLEYYLDPLKDLVIVGDGAKWIWNWAETFYPDAIQILDYYHAKKHLCGFAKEYFVKEQERNQWVEHMEEYLHQDQVGKVIENIKALDKPNSKKVEEKRQALVNYYQINKKRMLYKTFKEKNYMIGSGPIESAHRHVLQQRFKLSGQRWTKNGLQQLANLRIARKSNQWHKVTNNFKLAA